MVTLMNTDRMDNLVMLAAPTREQSETSGALNGKDLLATLRRQVLRLRTLVPVGAAFIILYALVTSALNVSLDQILLVVADVDPMLFVLAVAVFYGVFLVRMLRWRVLLENAGNGDGRGRRLPPNAELSRIMIIASFVNSISVAQLGDVYRGYLLKQQSDVPFTASVGTMIAERVLDVVLLALLLAGAALATFEGALPLGVKSLLLSGIAMAVTGIAGLLLLRRFHTRIQPMLPARVRGYCEQFVNGAAVSLHRVPLLVVYTAAGWLIEGLTLYLLAAAVRSPLSLAGALTVGLVASLLSIVPFTPGGLGVTEAGVVVVLSALSVDPATASAIAILNRIVNYWSLTPVGLALHMLGRKGRRQDRKGVHS